ncbi:IclR family transcriptional regulator [Burkholderia metallica]|uniref:IclR family transcriptional regulator n=1 Tax=Burkholderia metallica TaxID=488729 RepID=UPI0008417E03|nr:IclR family transcriptional regulator [Burkholderia metallica]AOJ35954.1 IclR family transcriptional regulator [Burkholderia metallica]MCA8000509.1 IclR family transcriptional regulator [Burkholderia metallica]MCA8020823.1 IclR family transcriptional regulator [Burkholderia metallica]
MTTYIVDAVDSALKLLTYVAEHPNLGVTELASQLGINKSRTYRMLCTLELHRFVVQDPRTSTYALGPQAFVIGVAASQQNALVRAAHRHMLALNQAINETVVLRVREGLESVCVARCETTHAVRTVGAVGNRRPIHFGASGKVLLAFAPDAVRDEYLAQLRRNGQADDPAKLAGELDAVARKGYAVSSGEVTPGAVGIAVPVRDLTGATVASVSVTGPEVRVSHADIPDYLERLQACSLAISAELGYVPARAALQPA